MLGRLLFGGTRWSGRRPRRWRGCGSVGAIRWESTPGFPSKRQHRRLAASRSRDDAAEIAGGKVPGVGDAARGIGLKGELRCPNLSKRHHLLSPSPGSRLDSTRSPPDRGA